MPRLEVGVRPWTLDKAGFNFDYVWKYERGSTESVSYYFGAYGFSNPYSANMFAYLYRNWGGACARSTTMLFEEELKKAAWKKWIKFVKIDWKGLVQEGAKGAIDWPEIVMDLAVEAGGYYMNKLRLSNALADQNNYLPTDDPEEYVDYAIAYWKAHPDQGPAYHVLSYNPRR